MFVLFLGRSCCCFEDPRKSVASLFPCCCKPTNQGHSASVEHTKTFAAYVKLKYRLGTNKQTAAVSTHLLFGSRSRDPRIKYHHQDCQCERVNHSWLQAIHGAVVSARILVKPGTLRNLEKQKKIVIFQSKSNLIFRIKYHNCQILVCIQTNTDSGIKINES